MLSTNSKKFYENLDAYVIDYMEDAAEDYEKPQPATVEEAYLLLWDIYKKEYFTPRGFGTLENFEGWGRGLPASGLFDFVLNNAVDTLGEMLEETQEERKRFTEQQAERVLFVKIHAQMVKNLNRLHKKQGVKLERLARYAVPSGLSNTKKYQENAKKYYDAKKLYDASRYFIKMNWGEI